MGRRHSIRITSRLTARRSLHRCVLSASSSRLSFSVAAIISRWMAQLILRVCECRAFRGAVDRRCCVSRFRNCTVSWKSVCTIILSFPHRDKTTPQYGSGTLSHAAFLRILGFTAGNPRMDLTRTSTSARVVRGKRGADGETQRGFLPHRRGHCTQRRRAAASPQ